MKKRLINIFAALLAIAACENTKEQQDPGIVEGEIVAPAYLKYDSAASSGKSVAVIWDSEEAYQNGAASYTVQLVKNQDEEITEGEISKTVMSYAPRRNDAYVFFDLPEFERYYVRIRADFSKGSSDWVYIADESGIPAVIEVGRGLVDGGIAPTVEPEIRMLNASAGTITVNWSVTGFEELAQDVKRGYHIALYKDEAGTDLDVAWGIDRSFFEGNYLSGSADISFPAFVFTGLESGKDYWVEVKDSVSTLKSPLFKVRTADSQVVQVGSSPASEGDILLYEDFDELLWGGQAWPVANGYNTMQRINVSSFSEARASGEVEIDAENGFYPVASGNSMVLFSTIQKIVPSTRLATWGQVCENGNKLQIGAKAGQILLGSSNLVGEIVTPPITNMSEVGTVELSFDAMPSYIRDRQDFKIEVISNSTFSTANNVVTVAEGGSYIASAFDIEPGYEYKRYTVEIENFPAGARIGLGGNRPAGYSGQMRFILDNICVKLLKYGETEVVLAKPVIESAMPAVGGALISWKAVPKAAVYAIQFRKTGDTEWIDFPSLIADTKATVTPFEKDVEYEVRIQAQVGKSKSEWSDAVKVSSAPFLQKLAFINDTQIGVNWSVSEFNDLSADLGEAYTFGVYKDEACSQKMWEWSTAANASVFNGNTPGHVFSGLVPSTDYWIKVSIASGASSVYKYTTLPEDRNFVLETPAKVGDIVLNQNFNEFFWGGGDPVRQLSGITLNSYSAAFGTPETSTNNKLANTSSDLAMFSHQEAAVSAYKKASTMAEWKGYMNKLSNPTTLTGIIRFGGSSTSGFLVSPSIAGLKGSSNKVKVTFTASTSTANHHIYVATLPAAVSVADSNPFYINTDEVSVLSTSEPFDLVKGEWKEFSIEVTLPAGGRIGIGTPVGTVQQAYLNDIKVELLETDYVAPDPDPVVQQKVWVNDSQIALRWSSSNFEDLTADLAEGYTFGIYKDESCSQKMWEWTTAANASQFDKHQPGHVFSGLAPGTDYWVKVTRASDGKGSVAKYTTVAEDRNFVASGTAVAGDVIVHENFNDILWGAGDPVNYLTGVDINSWTTFGKPDESSNNKLSNLTQDRGMLTNAHQGATTPGYAWFSDKPVFGWAAYYFNSSGTRANQFTTSVGGGLRFGGSNSTGYVVTPALSCLAEDAKVRLTIEAGAKKDAQKVYAAVFAADAASVGDAGVYISDAPVSQKEIESLSNGSWKSCSIELDVPAGGRVGIGTLAGGTSYEVYLTDVKIEVISIGGSTPPAPDNSLKQKAVYVHNTALGIRWTKSNFEEPATDAAASYGFGIYTDEACTSPVYAAFSDVSKYSAAAGPGYVFPHLVPGTDYWVKVICGSETSVVHYKTTSLYQDAIPQRASAAVSAGDVLLYEDFDELKIGSNFVDKLSGFWPVGASYTTGPYGDPSEGDGASKIVSGGTNSAYNTLNGIWAAASGTEANDWLASFKSLRFWKCKGTAPRQGNGYIYINNTTSMMVSPEIDCLSAKAKVKVSVTAAGFNSGKSLTVAVLPKNAALKSNTYYIDDSVSAVSSEVISLDNTVTTSTSGNWKEYSLEISLEPGQRVALGTTANGYVYLNDVKIDFVAYE